MRHNFHTFCMRLSVIFGFAAWCIPSLEAAEPITTESLLNEMIDMVKLADFPEPSYKTVQFSSYDRRSNLPGGPDWYANSDGFGREPIPNFAAVLEPPNDEGIGRYLICDVEGPGAIVRTWSARIEGNLDVYLDGSEQPIYSGPAQPFLQSSYLPFSTDAELPGELFDGTFRQRDASYFPIPFAKHCRIEWTGNKDRIHFYEVQIRRYDSGAQVETFRPKDMDAYESAIQRIANVLSAPQEHWVYQSADPPVAIDVQIEPGESAELLTLTGPQAIERLSLKLAADDLDRALRQSVLKINFDGHAQDQVQSPVGDFFGAAPGINPFDAVPLTVEADGTMTSRFVMPFAKSCQIQIENRSSVPISVTGNALTLEHAWDADRSMHFRARWRIDHDLVADGGAGAQDLPFLLARGQGVYVGTAIMLLNPNAVPTSYGNWWGEGDEKIFVDDDLQPSTFGTGSEDYFNYSWSSPDIFLHAFCGQPRNDGPANRGFVVNQRWHLLDALPFRHRLDFYMELFSHERTEDVSYARLAYHYGRPGMSDDLMTLTDDDLRYLELPADWQPAARAGARGATFFQADEIATTTDHSRLVRDPLWSGGQMLEWSPTVKTEELELVIPVPQDGTYAICLTAAMTPQAGRFSATLDGKPVKFITKDGTVNLRTDFRTMARTFGTPPLELPAGEHRLALRQLEPSASSEPRSIGVDFVWLQKR
jgi:hypothetical protein